MAKATSKVSNTVVESRDERLGRSRATHTPDSLKPVTKKGNITMAQADRAVREFLAGVNK